VADVPGLATLSQRQKQRTMKPDGE
jgi:hypothetical protein